MPQGKKQILPLEELTAISPLDGRYRKDTSELSEYFSEFALIRTRLEVEIAWLFFLSENKLIKQISLKQKSVLTGLLEDFSLADALEVKKHEEATKHDVKALEYFLRGKIASTDAAGLSEKIHFGLTSEDVNNLAYRLMLKRANSEIMLPLIDNLIDDILVQAKKHKNLAMLGRTHGQPAVPTTLGKELAVFAVRMNTQAEIITQAELLGKVTGAVGSFNALSAAFPDADWIKLSKSFVKNLGLSPTIFSTQINPYEDIIYLLQAYQRLNGVILDFDQDMWRYISDGWFIQEVKAAEVGSSTMPQKVNPIRFENSEGNLGLANSMIEHFTRKLPVARLQRDLSDSTVLRNLGVIFGYTLLAYKSTLEGLKRVKADSKQIAAFLEKDWSILTEGLQTILRQAGKEDSYSFIKSQIRGTHLSKKQWEELVKGMPIDISEKTRILKLTPESYIGLSAQIVDEASAQIALSKKGR